MGDLNKGIKISRRGFMKTAAMTGMAATFPLTNIQAAQGESSAAVLSGTRPSPAGRKRNLLFLSDNPENFQRLMDSIGSIKEYEINVIPMRTDFENPEAILNALRGKKADILFMSLPGIGMSASHIAESMETLDIPVIFLPLNLDLIMRESDLAASFRKKGTNALLANSEEQVLDLVKIVSAPRILEGRKVLIYGKPFASTSVPFPNLNAEYVYQQTGARIEHRSLDELRELVKGVDEAAAKKEMDRWKKDAREITGPTDKMILDSSKMYVLLKSIIEREGLSAVSMDCLSFSFSNDTSIPLPCLAYTRLRDEGVSAMCECDISMLLTSMVMQELAQRPSFQSNVSSVDTKKSSTVLRHCVAPTKIFGPDSTGLAYNLRDYHGMGKGAVPEIEYPVGLDVTMGAFSKDLKSFVLWPGIILPGIDDKNTPSFPDAPPEMRTMRKYCSVRAEVKIKDADRFLQSIAGIHHVLVAGSFSKKIVEAMIRMNVDLVTPPDLEAPLV